MTMRTLMMGAAMATAAMLAAAGAADATTYVGSRTIDTATLNLSITTDGTLGMLDGSNITDWNIGITDGAGSVTMTSSNSQVLVTAGLSATLTQLIFNFSGSGLALWELGTIGDSGPFYCVTTGGCYGEVRPSEGVSTVYGESPIEQVGHRGQYIIASTDGSSGAVGGVPEPAAWGLMLTGFAGLGVAMRARRKATLAA